MPEDEGCYLQGGIPHTALHGRPGHFATDPAQHFTERSGWNALETKRRLLEDWSPWFDPAKPWWLEKSPVNLTRTRLYQQLFPRSQFIVILRHPQLMAAALAKWTDEEPETLVRYALDAYDLVETDLAYLHSALILRYEDLVVDPVAIRKAALAFLGLGDHDPGLEIVDGNEAYPVGDNLVPDLQDRMAKWGYGTGGAVMPFATICRHPLRDIREAVGGALP